MAKLRVAGRQPRGWETLTARLHQVDQLQPFQQQMLDIQCRIVAADSGVLWEVAPNGFVPKAHWPENLDTDDRRSELILAMRQAAQAAHQRGQSQVLMMRNDKDSSESESNMHIFATVMRREGQVAAIATVAADCHDPDVITATAAARELAAGLYDGFQARVQAKQETLVASRIREAMAVLAVMQEAEGFRGGAMNLVNELARVMNCDAVSLGWIRRGSIHLMATSDADHIRRHTEQASQIELAMAECLDQAQPVVWPVPEDAEPMLSQAVTFSHRHLVGQQQDRQVISLPLRDRDELWGVLTLQRSNQPFSTDEIQRLQMIADVVSPQLADRFEGDRWLIGHAWRSLRQLAGYLVGPKHVGWKLLGVAVLAVVVYLAFAKWDYHISAPFVFKAQDRRTISVIYEGRLDEAVAQPGDRVEQGQLLAQLDTSQLELQRIETAGQLRELQIQRDQARAEGKQPEVARLNAKIQQIQTRLKLIDHRLDAAEIRSPLSGVVLAGYWNDKIGRVVEQGTPMFEIAPMKQLTAVLRVGEDDFDELSRLIEQGHDNLHGELTTKAEPGQEFAIDFERLVPVATVQDGTNAFEVWCTLEDPAPWLRPGMEGKARLDAGERPVAWLLSHRLVDAIHLWLWW